MRVVLVRDGRGRPVVPRRPSQPRVRRPARIAKNTIMMTVGNTSRNCGEAGCGSCGRVAMNRGAARPKFRKYTVALNKIEKTPLIQRACEGYEQFQNLPSTKVEVYEYDDGRKEVTEHVCFKIGKAHIKVDTVEDVHGNEVRIKPLEIGSVYMGEKGSPTKGGQQWIHSHKEDGGVPPIKVVDVESGIMMDIGGTGYVSDWLRR